MVVLSCHDSANMNPPSHQLDHDPGPRSSGEHAVVLSATRASLYAEMVLDFPHQRDWRRTHAVHSRRAVLGFSPNNDDTLELVSTC
jgi:hypothetical protein